MLLTDRALVVCTVAPKQHVSQARLIAARQMVSTRGHPTGIPVSFGNRQWKNPRKDGRILLARVQRVKKGCCEPFAIFHAQYQPQNRSFILGFPGGERTEDERWALEARDRLRASSSLRRCAHDDSRISSPLSPDMRYMARATPPEQIFPGKFLHFVLPAVSNATCHEGGSAIRILRRGTAVTSAAASPHSYPRDTTAAAREWRFPRKLRAVAVSWAARQFRAPVAILLFNMLISGSYHALPSLQYHPRSFSHLPFFLALWFITKE